jgi:hypothetical protein
VIKTRIAAAAGAVAFAGALVFAPSAFAADPVSPGDCPEGAGIDCHTGPDGTHLGHDPLHVIVRTEDGVLAGVRVGDVLCVRVEALSGRTVADARVHLPCRYPIRDCTQAARYGYHDVPSTDPRYRHYLDASDGDVDGIACKTPTTDVPAAPVTDAPPAPTTGGGTDVPAAPAPQTVDTHLPVTH